MHPARSTPYARPPHGGRRAINTVCEMSTALADDFADLLEDEQMRAVAAQYADATHRDQMKHMTVLGQMLHRKVFKPVRREVEGRKELEKRLSDRKKVRLDYDAYRRKQHNLLQSDPSNEATYRANLEAARRTFEKHQSGVMRDVETVNAERQQMVCDAFVGMLAAQIEFLSQTSAALQTVATGAERSLTTPSQKRAWGGAKDELKQLRESIAAPARDSPPARKASASGGAPKEYAPPVAGGGYEPPAAQQQSRQAATPPAQQGSADPFGFGLDGDGGGGGAQPAPATAPSSPADARRNAPRHASMTAVGSGSRAPAMPQTQHASAPNLLGGGFDAEFDAAFESAPASSGGYTPPQPAPAAAAPDDFMAAFGAAAPAPAPPPPASQQRSAPTPPPGEDLLGGMDDMFGTSAPSASRTTSAPGSSSNGGLDDLMGGFGGGGGGSDPFGSGADTADDFITALGSAPALVPQAAAPAPMRTRAQTMPLGRIGGVMGGGGGGGGLMDDPFGLGGGGGGGERGRGASATPSGDAVAVARQAMGGSATSSPSSAVDPFAPEERQRLQAKRLAEQEAAIAAKVQAERDRKAKEENNRETERELEKTLKLKVAQWQREKKNLRALLASLHEIAPPCSWKPMTLGELLDKGAVKKGYRKACLAVHPDKQSPDDLEAKVMAQLVFDALRDSWHEFEKTG